MILFLFLFPFLFGLCTVLLGFDDEDFKDLNDSDQIFPD